MTPYTFAFFLSFTLNLVLLALIGFLYDDLRKFDRKRDPKTGRFVKSDE